MSGSDPAVSGQRRPWRTVRMPPAPAPAGPGGPQSASPATTAQGTTPARAAGGRAMGTAALFRLLRVLVVVTCLVAGLVGAVMMQLTSQGLEEISLGTQQVLRLQTIKGDVLRADGLATNGIAQGSSESVSQRAEYASVLQEAARATVEASRAEARDQSGLSEVNAGLVNYVSTMELGRSQVGTDPVQGAATIAEATSVLRGDVVPALDQLIAANEQRIENARSSGNAWLLGVLILPIAACLLASVKLAQRTRRVINIGVSAALLASVLLVWLISWSMSATSRVVDDSRTGPRLTALSASRAYASLSAAKSYAGGQLIQPASAGAFEVQWSAEMAAVDNALGGVNTRQDELRSQVDAYRNAHQFLFELISDTRLEEAARVAGSTAPGGVNPAFTVASGTLSQVAEQARTQTVDAMQEQESRLLFVLVASTLLGVGAAIAASYGIGRRLEDYR